MEILNSPIERWTYENEGGHAISRVPSPDSVTTNFEYFQCVCGSDTFKVWRKPGEYSTWAQCSSCGLSEEVHSG